MSNNSGEYEYNAKVIKFEDHIEIVKYGVPRVHKAPKLLKNPESNMPINVSDSDETQLVQQTFRIKRKVKYYLQANSFNLFWTLTFDDSKVNAKNYVYARNRLRAWLKYQREKFGRFDYLFIPELHPSTGRIHFHGVTGGLAPPLTPARYPKSQRLIKKKGMQIYNADSWEKGFSTVSHIADKRKAANYITKYITKELMQIPHAYHQPRYFVSHGLKQPTVDYCDLNEDYFTMFRPNFVVGHLDSPDSALEKDVAIYQIDITSDGELVQDSDIKTVWKLKNTVDYGNEGGP